MARPFRKFTDNTELREEKNAPSLNVLKTGIPQVDENIEWFTKAGKNVNAITSSYPLLDQEDIIGVIFCFRKH